MVGKDFSEGHVKHLRKHKNILYGAVLSLLILQTVAFIFISIQISNVTITQQGLKSEVDSLEGEFESSRQEVQGALNEISVQIAQQKTDIQGEINRLKATQEDFSGVIDEVIRGVVSVGTDRSTGTGFFIDENYVVTNQHVIAEGSFVRILTFDGDVYEAEVVGWNVGADIALLQVEGSFDSLKVANSDEIQIGEKVIAIGNPFGLSFTVTEGIVSAVDRAGPSGLEAYIQTDVTLNPGNSGGPLINTEGEAIGMNNFKIGGAEGLGFALESNLIREVVNEIANSTIIE